LNAVLRLGVLISIAEGDAEIKPRVTAFEQELQKLGWTKDRNVRIHYRFASGDPNRIRSYALREAQIIIESWRRHYNSIRPHASLG
jgi:transposase InsO family protein